jgi:hypothetical protein
MVSSFNINNGSEFKLHFEYLCKSYVITQKPTTVKNPQANGILEREHQVLGQMLSTAELDMADSVTPNDIDVFLDNAALAICSTYLMVLNSLTTMDGRDRPLLNKFRSTLVSCLMFIRSQSLIACCLIPHSTTYTWNHSECGRTCATIIINENATIQEERYRCGPVKKKTGTYTDHRCSLMSVMSLLFRVRITR